MTPPYILIATEKRKMSFSYPEHKWNGPIALLLILTHHRGTMELKLVDLCVLLRDTNNYNSNYKNICLYT